MARLDATQKQWLTDLGVIVGDAATKAPEPPAKRNDKAGAPAATSGADALVAWKTGRTAALNSLKAVAGKVASAKHAKSAGAIAEIQGVVNKLTAEPTTLPQVIELQRYLGSDDIVHDVCELVEDIRTPLLAALGRMQTALAG